MLSKEEQQFITYWEQHRDKEKKVLKQWLMGLPVGMLFGIPILINLFSGWYKRANMDLNSHLSNGEFNPMVLIIALLIIISFVAIFSKRFKWEMSEQRYRELKALEGK